MNVRERLLSPVGQPCGQFVSRAGCKLEAAFSTWKIAVTGAVVADLGSNIGGFVDCLLQRGASKVYALDTGYGVLAWKLRKDPRVRVMERTNALFATLPEPVDLVTIDVGWTRQEKILPVAAKLLRRDSNGPGPGAIISLFKPQYESKLAKVQRGVLNPEQSLEVLQAATDHIEATGLIIRGLVESPIRGQGGNREFLLWLETPV